MSLAGLKSVDVERRRAERLRARCHASLQTRARKAARPANHDRAWLRRAFASGAAAAWCLVYLIEIIRRAAVIYGR
jgi:hypothetical protein